MSQHFVLLDTPTLSGMMLQTPRRLSGWGSARPRGLALNYFSASSAGEAVLGQALLLGSPALKKGVNKKFLVTRERLSREPLSGLQRSEFRFALSKAHLGSAVHPRLGQMLGLRQTPCQTRTGVLMSCHGPGLVSPLHRHLGGTPAARTHTHPLLSQTLLREWRPG